MLLENPSEGLGPIITLLKVPGSVERIMAVTPLNSQQLFSQTNILLVCPWK